MPASDDKNDTEASFTEKGDSYSSHTIEEASQNDSDVGEHAANRTPAVAVDNSSTSQSWRDEVMGIVETAIQMIDNHDNDPNADEESHRLAQRLLRNHQDTTTSESTHLHHHHGQEATERIEAQLYGTLLQHRLLQTSGMTQHQRQRQRLQRQQQQDDSNDGARPHSDQV